ncbi:MAG: murein biosynthesis integral membrane protein MurJ [Spirochaetales bacterium]|jgi:putative peptidoglycan lipid II flippase|nr:murein biosynthesis integral membrane protein MurJ [Spirochaetales bacterium]
MKIENTESSIHKSTLSTFLVAGTTLTSRLLGFVRGAVITAIFGAGSLADVINLTFSIPNNLRKLMAEGALSSAFIPVLSESILEGPEGEGSRNLVRDILTFQLLILLPLCLLTIIFARPLILLLTEFEEPWRIDLSVKLIRFFINYIIFISISAVLMAVLNSHSRFFIPAFTPILFSVFVISSVLLFYKSMGVYAMALGVLTGGFAQILFQAPLFRRLGYDFKIKLDFKNPRFQRILKQWGPVVATSSLFTINQYIAMVFASGLDVGSVSGLQNALIFWQLPFGIFSASITTVLFPRMSRQVTRGDMNGLRESVQYGLRFLFALLVPSAVVLSLFGKEIIAIAFLRGAFTVENTALTAKVLTGYCFGMFSVGAFGFLQRFFYSKMDYRTPFIISAIVVFLDIALSLWLKETPLQVTGLSIANSISYSIGFIIMIIFVRKSLQVIHGNLLFRTFWKVGVTAIFLGLFLWWYRKFTGDWWMQGLTVKNLLLLAGGGGGAVILTLGIYKLLGLEMLSTILHRGKS